MSRGTKRDPILHIFLVLQKEKMTLIYDQTVRFNFFAINTGTVYFPFINSVLSLLGQIFHSRNWAFSKAYFQPCAVYFVQIMALSFVPESWKKRGSADNTVHFFQSDILSLDFNKLNLFTHLLIDLFWLNCRFFAILDTLVTFIFMHHQRIYSKCEKREILAYCVLHSQLQSRRCPKD